MSLLHDTTVFVDYYRKLPKAEEYFESNELSCSIITVAELIRGVRNKREQQDVEKVLVYARVIPLNTTIGEKKCYS